MSSPPIPIVFEPILKPRPWGGDRLAALFGKPPPTRTSGEPIGESWELADLPGDVSHVARGPLAGRSIRELVDEWGAGLHGGAELVGGRFPLLIKFLDAREHLSIQVHPKPGHRTAARAADIKHEAWYVVHAERGAELFIGLRAGVTAQDATRAAGSADLVKLLRRWPARVGQCYYLPSGVVHALGAGVVVAEIQTPSDVTYRLYDWDRVDSAGRRRALHVESALANIRCDVPDELIVQPQSRSRVGGRAVEVTTLTRTERFEIDHMRVQRGSHWNLRSGRMSIWIVLAGDGRFDPTRGGDVDAPAADLHGCRFHAGDTVLIPAETTATGAEFERDAELLEVRLPMVKQSGALNK